MIFTSKIVAARKNKKQQQIPVDSSKIQAKSVIGGLKKKPFKQRCAMSKAGKIYSVGWRQTEAFVVPLVEFPCRGGPLAFLPFARTACRAISVAMEFGPLP